MNGFGAGETGTYTVYADCTKEGFHQSTVYRLSLSRRQTVHDEGHPWRPTTTTPPNDRDDRAG